MLQKIKEVVFFWETFSTSGSSKVVSSKVCLPPGGSTPILIPAGGKGRTGTMICVWLIETGVFSSAEESLTYFGHRRTDTNVTNKFQASCISLINGG